MNEGIFKRFSQKLLVGTILLLLATAAFNRVVDPFQYFGTPRITGFNAVKSRLRLFEREVKPTVVKREQPEAVILGSSVSDIGFEPLHPALTSDGGGKSYNFGMVGASWKETTCALEYVLANTDAKRIIFGMPPQAMPEEDCTRILADMNKNRLAEMLVSPLALYHSQRTLFHQDPQTLNTHSAEGRYLFARYDSHQIERVRRTQQFLAVKLLGKATCSEDRLRHSLEGPAEAPLGFDTTTPFDLSGLARILAQVSGRNIQLRIVLYPQHVVGAEVDYLCGEAQQRWFVMDRIARYLEQHPPVPPATVEVWDFQDYGPLFDEPLDGNLMTYWQDCGHFNPELGDLMLNAMFGVNGGASDPVTGFGYRVTSATLERRYRWLLHQRRTFLQTHPETWDTLLHLVPPEAQRSEVASKH